MPTTKKTLYIDNEVVSKLNDISAKITKLYGFVTMDGECSEVPAINAGPCGPFANIFHKTWNENFVNKVSIVFIISRESNLCDHIAIRLPNNLLFDGGIGVHDEQCYDANVFKVIDMSDYDRDLLEKHSFGLTRKYPRYCPNFSEKDVKKIIEDILLSLCY